MKGVAKRKKVVGQNKYVLSISSPVRIMILKLLNVREQLIFLESKVSLYRRIQPSDV